MKCYLESISLYYYWSLSDSIHEFFFLEKGTTTKYTIIATSDAGIKAILGASGSKISKTTKPVTMLAIAATAFRFFLKSVIRTLGRNTIIALAPATIRFTILGIALATNSERTPRTIATTLVILQRVCALQCGSTDALAPVVQLVELVTTTT